MTEKLIEGKKTIKFVDMYKKNQADSQLSTKVSARFTTWPTRPWPRATGKKGPQLRPAPAISLYLFITLA